MIKYAIPIVMLLVLAGLSSGTMWLYTDPTFFSGLPSSTIPYSFEYQSGGTIGSFRPLELSPFEIINSPFFPMLGRGFSMNASREQDQSKMAVVSLGSSGKLDKTPPQITFSGGLENNLKYAQSKSSIRVGQKGSWENLNNPGLL